MVWAYLAAGLCVIATLHRKAERIATEGEDRVS